MFQDAHTAFLNALTNTVSNIASSMSAALAGPITAALTLYILFYGYNIMRGTIAVSGVDFAYQAIKIGIINMLVTNAGTYSSMVGSLIVTGLPELANQVVGGAGTIPSDGIFSLGDQIVTDLRLEIAEVPWRQFGTIFYYSFLATTVAIITLVISAIAFAYTIMIQFAFALIASVGPIFIAFALFDFSRGWFFAWLGQALNFFVLTILVSVLGIILIQFIQNLINSGNAVDIIYGAYAMIAAALISIFIFFLLPSLAAGMTQGAQASTGAAQRYVERNLGRGKNNNNSNNNQNTGSVSQR